MRGRGDAGGAVTRAVRWRVLAWLVAAAAAAAAAGSGWPRATAPPAPAVPTSSSPASSLPASSSPSSSLWSPLHLEDDRGRIVVLPASPTRIVSLAPHATELLFASGAGPKVVAVDRDSDYPPAARSLPRVAAYPQPDVEQLLALTPDLVVIWGPGAPRALVARLEQLGLAVFVSEPRTLDEVGATLARFAKLSDDPAAALGTARAFRARLAQIRARYAQQPVVRVFVQIWTSPLIGIGGHEVIADAVRSCGARSVLSDAAIAAPRVDPEAVIAARPAMVLATDGERAERFWRERGLLAPRGPARFAAFDASTMERPGPRVLDALEQMCAAIDAARAPS